MLITEFNVIINLIDVNKVKTSNEIEIIGTSVIPTLKEKTYSSEEWLKWVLEGTKTMPGYNQILHPTDALKIKTYLDGL